MERSIQPFLKPRRKEIGLAGKSSESHLPHFAQYALLLILKNI